MKTYVIHYDKLESRKTSMQQRLKANAIEAEWFVQNGFYDQVTIDNYIDSSWKEWKRKVRVANRPIIFRPLTKSEVHLSINHFMVGEKIVKGEADIALVLEDDALLIDDFKNKLQLAMEKIDDDWDILFLDYLGGFAPKVTNLTIIKNRDKYDYYGTCAYVIKKETWEKMINMNEKISLPSDEEFKYRINQLGLKPAWILPTLVTHGSKHYLELGSVLEQRDKQGVKRYIAWRRQVYVKLPKAIREFLFRVEARVKKIILGIS